MKTINFKGFTCNVNVTTYQDGNPAILLVDSTDGSPVATASVNVPDSLLDDDMLFIKDWSENSGILQVLVEAGIVEDTGRTFPTGFCEANLCRLLN